MDRYVLNEYHRDISDEELLYDLKRVADKLNKSYISKSEYVQNGRFSCEPFKRFGSWLTALEKADLQVSRSPEDYKRISNKELLDDVIRVANQLEKDSISTKEYDENGHYAIQTILARFKTWNDTLEKALLKKTEYKVISDLDLFEEIERLWEKKGSQPTTNDIKNGLSKYSLNTFSRRFGGWRSSLIAFTNYINTDDSENRLNLNKTVNKMGKTADNIQHKVLKDKLHRTSRDINLKLRYKVLTRDNFKCCVCGASPAKDSSVELHVDHITPWSKGGETEIENLQTLCSKCNLGKSDLTL